MTDIRLHLASDDLPPAAIQSMARDIAQAIGHKTDATAAPPVTETRPDTRGEPVTIGVLTVSFLTGGTAVALVNLLKSFFDRNRRVSFTVERPDGHKITLSAANLDDAQALAAQLMG